MSSQEARSFGAVLSAALVRARMTQQALATELNTNPSQVSRWANNKATPHIDTVKRLEEVLGADLAAAFRAAVPEHELYVSAPITGLAADDVGAHHDAVELVVEAARRSANGVYWPGHAIRGPQDLSAPDIATERNMKALAHCHALLYVQLVDVVGPSSALVELGIALGARMKTTIVLGRDVRPAFMLNGFGAVAANSAILPQARIYTIRDAGEAARLLAKDGREILGLA
jgi:transcriptional regulator with XRE-family HTH domain